MFSDWQKIKDERTMGKSLKILVLLNIAIARLVRLTPDLSPAQSGHPSPIREGTNASRHKVKR
jgi:hypothetical protein